MRPSTYDARSVVNESPIGGHVSAPPLLLSPFQTIIAEQDSYMVISGDFFLDGIGRKVSLSVFLRFFLHQEASLHISVTSIGLRHSVVLRRHGRERSSIHNKQKMRLFPEPCP